MDETEVSIHEVEIKVQTLAPGGANEGTHPLEAEGAAWLEDGKDTH